MQATTLRVPRPSKPSIAHRAVRAVPSALPMRTELTADAVVEYLTKLSAEERAELLSRVEPHVEPPRPQAVVPLRETLTSTDLEALAANDILFDAMHELSFFETAIEGGSFCLVQALRAVPCLAGIVHLLDVSAREYVAVYAHGPRSERVLRSRRPDTDPLLSRAASTRAPIVVEYGVDGAPKVAERHGLFGDPWNVLVVPVVHGGRVLAAIELVDALDGAPFGEGAIAALRYVAEKYGEFLAEKGVVVRSVVPPAEIACAVP